jgi:hypothetical protein
MDFCKKEVLVEMSMCVTLALRDVLYLYTKCL